jgi:glycosyltransferase involved in cell wall biosynthesis
MNIGFEAKRIFTNMTGLGNYSRFVVNALSEFQPDNRYFLYTPRKTSNTEVNETVSRENVEVVIPGKLFRASKSVSLWRTWGVSKHASIRDLDIFHGLSQEIPVGLPKKVKKIVTVHDLIFFRFSQFYNPIDVSIYKFKLRHACRMADKVIAISQQTRQDLIDLLQVDGSKIEVVYQGSHPNFKVQKSADEVRSVRIKYNLPERYILNVGTIEPRKNLLTLVKAVASMRKQSLPLVVIGRRTKYFNDVLAEVQRLRLDDKVIFLHTASFADFPAIYQGATVFAYPSLFEGFGIPLVEAIESRIPVITSKGSCFSEAAGPSSIYIDPENVEDLASQLHNVLNDGDLREQMVQQSSQYIQRFQPSVIAANLMSIYKSF